MVRKILSQKLRLDTYKIVFHKFTSLRRYSETRLLALRKMANERSLKGTCNFNGL